MIIFTKQQQQKRNLIFFRDILQFSCKNQFCCNPCSVALITSRGQCCVWTDRRPPFKQLKNIKMSLALFPLGISAQLKEFKSLFRYFPTSPWLLMFFKHVSAVGFVKGNDAVLEYCIRCSFALYSNINATAFLRLDKAFHILLFLWLLAFESRSTPFTCVNLLMQRLTSIQYFYAVLLLRRLLLILIQTLPKSPFGSWSVKQSSNHGWWKQL